MAVSDFSLSRGVFWRPGCWFLDQMASLGPLKRSGGVALSDFDFTYLSTHPKLKELVTFIFSLLLISYFGWKWGGVDPGYLGHRGLIFFSLGKQFVWHENGGLFSLPLFAGFQKGIWFCLETCPKMIHFHGWYLTFPFWENLLLVLTYGRAPSIPQYIKIAT